MLLAEMMILMLLISISTTTLAIYAHDRVEFMSRSVKWCAFMAAGIVCAVASMIVFVSLVIRATIIVLGG